MTRRVVPADPDRLPELIAQRLAGARLPHPLRVAVDGPPCADAHALADALVEPLRLAGRPALRVRADSFWRDASLRLEHGRTDVDSYAHDWLDTAALRREVLDPLGPGGDGRYLPSLRDPATNRATRAAPMTAPDGAVMIVSGALLLWHDLPFDRSVHLAVSAPSRRRRTVPDQAWTLPAFDAYDAAVRPGDLADVVVRLDDPRHPAITAVADEP